MGTRGLGHMPVHPMPSELGSSDTCLSILSLFILTYDSRLGFPPKSQGLGACPALARTLLVVALPAWWIQRR